MDDCDALPDYTGYLHAISCDDGDDGSGDCNGVSHYLMTDLPTAGNSYGRTWLMRAGLVFIDDTQKPPVTVVYSRSWHNDAWPGPADSDCQGDFNA